MNWITVSWPMVAAACLTLGLIELRIGLAQQHLRAARLLFALSACAMASAAGLELALTRVGTIAAAEMLLRARGMTLSLILVSLTGFVWSYFRSGNKWIALAVLCLCVIGWTGDFVPGTFHHKVAGMRTIEVFGGATIIKLDRMFSVWNLFIYLEAVATIAFVADASGRLWRHGERRRVLVIGGSITLCILAGSIHSILVSTGKVNTPYMVSWAYLAILIAMASELNADVLAAAQLAGQLRESERRMDQASAAAGLGMWSWDIVGDTIWATDRARAMVGFDGKESLDMAHFLGALHPDDRGAVKSAVESALVSERGHEVEFRVILPIGQTRWIASRGQVERDIQGKPILLRGVVLDVTARHTTDAELLQLHTDLAHASRVSMMGQLASALAHELSQPLGAILRNTEAAELFLQRDSPDLDELRTILTDIRQDNQRASGVIEHMRALLKRSSLEKRVLSMSAVMDDVVALTRNDALARKVQFEISAASGQLWVMGNPVQLQQVLLNLVLNSMDAVSDLPLDRRKVRLQAQRHGEREVEVAVADSGTGIAPERLVHLFQPFYTTKPSGLGIGLSISRTIVEAHGGQIWAENNAGEGAIFRFTLPLAKGVISA